MATGMSDRIARQQGRNVNETPTGNEGGPAGREDIERARRIEFVGLRHHAASDFVL
jgi:hypothetical protein